LIYPNLKKNNYIAVTEIFGYMIYKFVVISAEEESFMREFEMDENNTLLDFHNTLQEELEYEDSHMATFFTTNDNWEKEEEFTLFDMGSDTTVMDEVIIDDIVILDNQKLLYIFDLFNERAFFIECLGTTAEIEGREYPVCSQSHGRPPMQLVISDISHDELSKSFETDNDTGIDDQGDLPDFENIDDIDDL